MSYFKDLTPYSYHSGMFYRPNTLSIGWLALGQSFTTKLPSEELLALTWSFCKISVAQMRGIHKCEFCSTDDWFIAERNGERLLLGTSETRVFSPNGIVYAAPTLIYHYISVHNYCPPEEFLVAMKEGPQPFSQEYIEQLELLKLEWGMTSVPEENAKRFRIE